MRCDAVESFGIRAIHACKVSSMAPAAGAVRDSDGAAGVVCTIPSDPGAGAGSAAAIDVVVGVPIVELDSVSVVSQAAINIPAPSKIPIAT